MKCPKCLSDLKYPESLLVVDLYQCNKCGFIANKIAIQVIEDLIATLKEELDISKTKF